MTKHFDWNAVQPFLQKRKADGASYKIILIELEELYGKKVTAGRLSQLYKTFAKQAFQAQQGESL